MKRVLFLAYYFPPVGGGGVQRAVKFCRYLVDFGYKPIVVTGPGGSSCHWAPEDQSLMREIPPEVEVYRVPGPEPAPPTPWQARVARVLDLMPHTLRWWVEGALDVGRQLGNIDVILAELVPYATAHAASRLARELDVPWVADLQDPWALDEMWLYPSYLHRARDERRMRRLLGSAEAIVMNTPEAAARVRRRFPELAPRVTDAIPNGFDPADYEAVVPAERPPGVFRVVHAGYLHTESGLRHRRTRRARYLLGGAPVRGVDFLTRSHVFLLEAIGRLIEREPTLASEIELHLAGVLTPVDRAVAAASPVAKTHGYLSHSETIALILSADLLFLPMHDLPKDVRAGLVPGKAYEYLGSRRPILAAVPDGDARDWLSKVRDVSLCRPSDVAGMAEIIESHIRAWRRGLQVPAQHSEVVAQFERRRQTQRLAAILTDAVQSKPMTAQLDVPEPVEALG